MLNGAWTRTWQGTDPAYDDTSQLTIYQAIEKVTEAEVYYVEGCGIDEIRDVNKALKVAENTDVIIACMGEKPSTEIPGNIDDLALQEAQIEYVQQLAKTGKPIVLVLVENRPRLIRKIEPLCDAIIMAYQPAYQGSKALADILYGKVNPSGKLPITYPRFANTLMTYDHKHTEAFNTDFSLTAYNPQYSFGHGLSYTDFKYSDLTLSDTSLATGGEIVISVKVENVGKLRGKETVLLYVRDDYASITPSVKRLRKFRKIALEAGEKQLVKFTILEDDLAFVGKDNQWVTEKGSFTVLLGEQEAKFNYTTVR